MPGRLLLRQLGAAQVGEDGLELAELRLGVLVGDGMITSWPTVQSAGVATFSPLAVCRASSARSTSAKLRPTFIG